MNKVFAQLIDKTAITLLLPRFNASQSFINQNMYLLENSPHPPRRLIKTPKLFLKPVKRKGAHDIYDFAFPSRVETPHLRNNTVYGRYFKLANGAPKSTVILLHGMHESKHRYQEKHALNLARSGHDCLIMTLPYHIERAVKGSASGSHYLSTDLKGIFEALQQGIKDVLALINWLMASGEKKIGLLGIGLGGLIAGLVASATRKINYLVLMAPATTPLQITGYMMSNRLKDERIQETGLAKAQFLELFTPWELEHHKPLVTKNRILILEGLHDTVVSSESVDRLWNAWGKPHIKRYNHGHLSMMTTRRSFKDIGKFLDKAFEQQKSAGLSK